VKPSWPDRHQRLAWTVVGVALAVSLLMVLAAIFLDTGG
jgi:cell division protein FtsX